MMLCLGIESSCDETGLALVGDGRLKASVLASQAPLHAIFGGVVPELASREHARFMGPLFDELLKRARISPQDIDAIAVARGPGLLGSLLAGVSFAKALSLGLGKPLIGVNHLHAHLLAAGLEHGLKYPAIGLVASGGHTELYKIESPANFQRLGRAIDDAAGEAFDKIGKILGFPYPAGKHIDEIARKGKIRPGALPCPYVDNENLDFSFSGLKTAAILEIEREGSALDEPGGLEDFCASFNAAIAAALRVKAARALDKFPDAGALWLSGGVAANSMIRSTLEDLMREKGGRLLAPSPHLCADNGAMIAYAGWLLIREGWRHSLDLEAIPRGRPIPEDAGHESVPPPS